MPTQRSKYITDNLHFFKQYYISFHTFDFYTSYSFYPDQFQLTLQDHIQMPILISPKLLIHCHPKLCVCVLCVCTHTCIVSLEFELKGKYQTTFTFIDNIFAIISEIQIFD